MKEKNRNSIENCLKLPQFTTMNVIDGQAGLVIYASLIFNSLTIDNILNIIVLIILAGIAINLTLGENGIFTKAKEAAIKQDIEETRELIKLELMGSIGEETGDYTNKDVVDAVKKITNKDVNVNANTVISKKENEVDISDFWKKDENLINFTFNGRNFSCKKGTYLDDQGEDNLMWWVCYSGEVTGFEDRFYGGAIGSALFWQNKEVYSESVYGEDYVEVRVGAGGIGGTKLINGGNYKYFYKNEDQFVLIPLD